MFCVSCLGQCTFGSLLWFDGCGAGPEPEAVVSGLQNMAAMSEAIEQRGGHFRITEDCGPFGEAEVGGDDDASLSR